MNFLSHDEGMAAVSYARNVLEHHIKGTLMPEPDFTVIFSKNRGVFVTLKKNNELRGCIGFPYPVMPLKDAVHDAAISAATGDPRFPPVSCAELDSLEIEITVLSLPEEVKDSPENIPDHIEIGRHGLIIRGHGHSGLLLPQVPVEWNWNKNEFLDHTCIKAGLPAGVWKDPSVQLFTFEGQIFNEEKEQ